MKRTSFILLCWCACSFMALPALPAFTQDALRDSERALVKFDFNFSRLRSNPVVQELEIDKMIRQSGILLASSTGGLELKKVNRVYGGLQPPSQLSQFQEMAPGDPLPINFFFRIEFADEATAASFWEELDTENSVRHEFGGKEFVSPPSSGPQNLRAHRLNDLVIEIGTDRYLYLHNRNVFSEAVQEQWDKLPNDSGIRLAVDLASAQALVDQGLDMARRQAPPEAFGLIELATKIGGIALAFDLDSEHLLKLVATGRDPSAAEDLERGLNGLLGMVKMQMGGAVQNLDDEARKIAQPIMEALTTQREGTDVVLEIPKPGGFIEFMSTMARNVRAQAQEAQQMNRLRQIALAIHNHHAAHGQFPFHPSEGQSDNLSWRVRVLPFVAEGYLFDQMDAASGWDSEKNKAQLDNMPEPFGTDSSLTDIAWVISDVTRFPNIADGTSNTIMLIQLPKPSIPWTKNEDLTLEQALELLKRATPEEPVIVCYYDGSVHRFTGERSEEDYRALLTPDGGEVVGR